VILSLIGVVITDNFLLPYYVSSDKNVFLPDCRGEYQDAATKVLSDLNLDVKIINLAFNPSDKPGTVIKMFPPPFTKVKENRLITISIAGSQKNVIIPDLHNISLRNAQIEILNLDLLLDTVMYEFNSNVKNGYVSFQIPKKGTMTKTGTPISLGISKGVPPDYFIVPDLINYPFKKALEKIQFEGLRLGDKTYEYQPNLLPNTIIDQSFPPGLKVTIPVKIDLVISKETNEK
tara:strand:- start:1846 stop:2544 length:699 start_codon:yes stop_codon:yes gene_type:complete